VRELLRSTDWVLISAVQAELAAHGIGVVVLDTHTSIVEGSLGVLPRRLMVAEEDAFVARRVVEDFRAAHET